MSLIGVWRDRKQLSTGPNRPPRLWKLIVAIIVVGIVLWRLAHFG
jgi:hypothetical protein